MCFTLLSKNKLSKNNEVKTGKKFFKKKNVLSLGSSKAKTKKIMIYNSFKNLSKKHWPDTPHTLYFIVTLPLRMLCKRTRTK